jgi:hypothetical protein
MKDLQQLRHLDERRCERLVAKSALLDTSDLRWETAAAVELDDAALACLVYMRDVEGFTTRELSGLAGHPTTLADPLIRRFLTAWRAEEAEAPGAAGRCPRCSRRRARSRPGRSGCWSRSPARSGTWSPPPT